MVLLTSKDVARILNQTVRNVAHLVESGKLKNVAPESSNSFLFDKKEVDEFKKNRLSKRSKKNAHISTNNIRIKSSQLNE